MNKVAIISIIVVSIFFKQIYSSNYTINDKYIMDCMRSE